MTTGLCWATCDCGRRSHRKARHLMLQNGGRLFNSKRDRFDELTDAEIAAMEQAVQRALATTPDV